MKKIFLIIALYASTAFAGKIEFPDEMAYPNVIQPIIQFGGIQDLNSKYLGKIEDITFLDERRLLISDSSNAQLVIVELGDNLIFKEIKIEGLLYPKGVFSSGDEIFVIDSINKKLIKLDKYFKIHSIIDLKEMFFPWDVSIADDMIFVTDNQANRISVYHYKTGEFLKHLLIESNGIQINLPLGIASNGSQIIVADAGNNRLVSFNSEGIVLAAWGNWGAYGGQMATPYNLDIQAGRVFLADQINHRLQVFSITGEFMYQWARHPPKAHEGQGRVHYPTSISASPSGKIIAVCEVIENRCQIFGEKITSGDIAKVDDSAWWEKATRFHYGKRTAINEDVMAVSEPDTHSVLIFKMDELPNNKVFPKFITRIGGQGTDIGSLIQPSGIIVDAKEKRVWVSDRGNNRLQQFEFSETPLPSTDDSNTLNLVSPKMTMGTGSSKFVKAIDFDSLNTIPNAEVLSLTENMDLDSQNKIRFGEPSAMSRHPSGEIYMIDPMSASVHVFSKNMSHVRSWGEYGKKDHQLIKPLDIAISSDGKIYIVDEYAFKIKVYTPGGKYLFSWGGSGIDEGQFIAPFGIAINSKDEIFVSDTVRNKINKFNKSGKFISSWGAWGINAGEFYKPKGLSIDDKDRLIVMDFGNHRGQIFDSDGAFIEMFGISEKPLEVNRGEK